MSTAGISYCGETDAAIYAPEVARVCLNCRRPGIERACGAHGCPAFRAAVAAYNRRKREERIRAAKALDMRRMAR